MNRNSMMPFTMFMSTHLEQVKKRSKKAEYNVEKCKQRLLEAEAKLAGSEAEYRKLIER